MDNKKVDAARIVLKCLGVVAAVFALIGSIGCMVTASKLNNMANLGSSSSSVGMQALNALMSLVRNYDFARVGALIIMGFASILAVLDKASGNAEHGVSLFTSVMAALGFIAVFMTSLAISVALVYAEANSAANRYSSILGSSFGGYGSYSSSSQPSGTGVRIMYTIAMILIMLSAVAMIISLIFSIYRLIALKSAARAYANQQYAQQYAQQYPQQGYPQYPQQQYPQQEYPQQQYPQYQNQYPNQNNNNNMGV